MKNFAVPGSGFKGYNWLIQITVSSKNWKSQRTHGVKRIYIQMKAQLFWK